jgi:HEAT repeat protein
MKYSQARIGFLSFLVVFAVTLNVPGADVSRAKGQRNDPAESKLIADMASDDTRKVLNALDGLEGKPDAGTNVILAARKLLPDPRPVVRKKAARVLGAIHAPLDGADLKAICRMLKSYDKSEADDALKALRGLEASETIPEIIPLLKSPHDLLVRDACRTLAVLGSKEQIPVIEPSLKHSNSDVRIDAQSAITTLQAKN